MNSSPIAFAALVRRTFPRVSAVDALTYARFACAVKNFTPTGGWLVNEATVLKIAFMARFYRG